MSQPFSSPRMPEPEKHESSYEYGLQGERNVVPSPQGKNMSLEIKCCPNTAKSVFKSLNSVFSALTVVCIVCIGCITAISMVALQSRVVPTPAVAQALPAENNKSVASAAGPYDGNPAKVRHDTAYSLANHALKIEQWESAEKLFHNFVIDYPNDISGAIRLSRSVREAVGANVQPPQHMEDATLAWQRMNSLLGKVDKRDRAGAKQEMRYLQKCFPSLR